MASPNQRQAIGLLDNEALVDAINEGMAASAPQAISARIDAHRAAATKRGESDLALLRSARPLDIVSLNTDGSLSIETGPSGKRWRFTLYRERDLFACSASREVTGKSVFHARVEIRDVDIVRVARVVKQFAQSHYGELEMADEV